MPCEPRDLETRDGSAATFEVWGKERASTMNSADFAIEVNGLDIANITKTAEIIDIIFFNFVY